MIYYTQFKSFALDRILVPVQDQNPWIRFTSDQPLDFVLDFGHRIWDTEHLMRSGRLKTNCTVKVLVALLDWYYSKTPFIWTCLVILPDNFQHSYGSVHQVLIALQGKTKWKLQQKCTHFARVLYSHSKMSPCLKEHTSGHSKQFKTVCHIWKKHRTHLFWKSYKEARGA